MVHANKLHRGLQRNGTFKTPTKSSSGSGGGGNRPPGGGSSGSSSQALVVYTASTPTLTGEVSVTGGTEYFAGVVNIGGTVTGGTEVTLSSYTSSGGGPGERP